MTNSVTLSSAVQQTLLYLDEQQALSLQTEQRLATGKKVNSAIDDAVSYFQAQALSNHSNQMDGYKSGIEQGIDSLTVAVDTTENIVSGLQQTIGLLTSLKTAADLTTRKSLGGQITTLFNQINYMINDSSYQGLNMLNGVGELQVQMSDNANAIMTVNSTNTQMSALVVPGTAVGKLLTTILLGSLSHTLTTGAGAKPDQYATLTDIDNAINILNASISSVQATASQLGSNVTFLENRLDFTTKYIVDLTAGVDDLVLANSDEEAANMLALQTQESLTMKALSFANQSEQSILSLF